MASLLGATCGLMAFAAMIVRGLISGNPADVILTRALAGLFGFLVVGTIAGWIAERILDDQAARKAAEPGVKGDHSSTAAARH